MDDKSAPAPDTALSRHIADHLREFAEVARHFGQVAATTRVTAEKEDALARVDVANRILEILK